MVEKVSMVLLIFVVVLVSGCQGEVSSPVTEVKQQQIIDPLEKCGEETCLDYQKCINNKCILKEANYKYGLVYAYNNPNTYNQDWKIEFEEITSKVENALKDVTDSKLDAHIEILGEVRTDIFCWNPATVGAKVESEIGGHKIQRYIPMPGSAFTSEGVGFSGDIVESYCDNCVMDEDNYKIDCEAPLIYANLFQSNKLRKLEQQIGEELGFNFNDYRGVFIIFGRLGQILPEENNMNLEYRCNTMAGIIGGYDNLIMAENSIKAGGLVPCSRLNSEKRSYAEYYDKPGWHSLVHELLHKFGAVDIYETGTTFGLGENIEDNKKLAEELDPKAQQSIMGDNLRDCMEIGTYEKDGVLCTSEELEEVYLDKFNRQKLGLE